MKIDRLIGILSILLQREKVTAPYLAEKFEVSRRTINRDIETLSKAGIPVVTSQGAGGGLSIMEGYKLDKTLLTSSDMQAIISGLRSLDSVSGTNSYRLLMEKLSIEDKNPVDADRSVIVDLSSWDKSAVSDKFDLIKHAIENSQRIEFYYCSPNGECDRSLEPCHLIFQWSDWYVWGYCMMRNDYRMFKLSRMSRLKNTGEACAKREIPEYTSDKLCHTKDEIEATVRFDKEVKWRVVDEFGADRIGYDEDGDIVLTFTWSDIPAFYRYILSFGDKAEILEPESYRKGFEEIIIKMKKKYET